MAIRDKDEPYWFEQLQLEDERKLRFYLREIIAINKSYNIDSSLEISGKLKPLNYNARTLMNDIINKLLDEEWSHIKLLNHLTEKEKDQFIDKKEFDWITVSNPRLCYYIWLSILHYDYFESYPTKQKPNYPNIIDVKPVNEEFNTTHWACETLKYETNSYTELNLCNTPLSSEECKSLVILYFDSIRVKKEKKISTLRKIRYQYSLKINQNHKMTKTINNGGAEESNWMIDYIHKSFQLMYRAPQPTNNQDIKGLALSMIDSLDLPDANKILFLNRAYSAFHAKKFKEKEKEYRGHNMWLGAEEYHKLIKISEKSKQDKKLSLKLIIDAEYRKLFD